VCTGSRQSAGCAPPDPTPRAVTRDCRPRHPRKDDGNPLPRARQLGAPDATPEDGYLGMALRRFNVKLYGKA